MPIPGAHVSASGGLDKAVSRAEAIGAEAMQIFSGSPRVWKRSDLKTVEVDEYLDLRDKLKVNPVVTHAMYLVNLASDKDSLVQKSIDALVYDMQFDAKIKGAGIVVHIGSHQGRGWDAVKEQVAQHISTIIEQSPDEATFLIENSAGQNGKIASDLAEIRWLLDQVQSPQLGWCFDTCHAFTAGYALGTNQPTTAAKPDNQRQHTAQQAIDELDLWDALKCVHVNDSKGAFGSGLDRHENLGDGEIASDDMAHFLNVPQLKNLPTLLEVPGLDGKGPDATNISRLKQLLA